MYSGQRPPAQRVLGSSGPEGQEDPSVFKDALLISFEGNRDSLSLGRYLKKDLKHLSKVQLEVFPNKVVDLSPGIAGHELHQIVNNPEAVDPKMKIHIHLSQFPSKIFP